MTCQALGGNSLIESDLKNAGIVEQSLLTKEFSSRIKMRERLLEELDSDCSCHLPGVIPDQSTQMGAATIIVL